MPKGRQRNLEKEATVINLLARGLPVGEVAVQTGVHRNTVRNIRTRVRKADLSGCTGVEDLAAQEQVIRRLREDQENLIRSQKAAEHQLKCINYKMAVESLLVLIEKAANAVTKSHSVWTQVYLDKPTAGDGSLHDIVQGSATDASQLVENAEMSELLESALEKLTEFQQRVLKLSFWEGQTTSEIAESLGADESEIHSAQTHGLVQLRQLVGTSYAEV